MRQVTFKELVEFLQGRTVIKEEKQFVENDVFPVYTLDNGSKVAIESVHENDYYGSYCLEDPIFLIG